MTNFKIEFAYPWLLLLFIPAVVLTLISYFKLNKRYRFTRNRIVSIVCHLIVMALSITALAGIQFSYDIPNRENEIILLVDVSDSSKSAKASRDSYVKTLLDESRENFRMGIVTFGYGCEYVAEMSNDTDRVYQQYRDAKAPDTSATNIAEALRYTRTLFSNPDSAKIVLISDGAETDGNALSTIKSISATGIKVDTVHIPYEMQGEELQIVNVELPDYSIFVGDSFTVSVTLQSTYDPQQDADSGKGLVNLRITDKNENGTTETLVPVQLTNSQQVVELEYSFDIPKMHELQFTVEANDPAEDTITKNNVYCSYMYLQSFDNVLVLERAEGESAYVKGFLEQEGYKVTPIQTSDADNMPKTLDELRAYDQVVMVNIANADMPAGFDKILHSYVYDVGGGVFTVGGNKIEGGVEVANAYNREDMYGTLYQQMLPVQAINYTPPVGVIIIIDRSSSMGTVDSGTGKTMLDIAKEGARAALDALTERDYCGVMSLDDRFGEVIKPTPIPRQAEIIEAIERIEYGGATAYSGAIERAGNTLSRLSGVEKKHIILISDGMPGDNFEQYSEKIRHCHDELNITTSIVSIGGEGENATLEYAAEQIGGGVFYDVWKPETLTNVLKTDLKADEIKEVVYGEFQPTVGDHTAVLNDVDEEDIPTLDGFYGTKAKNGAEVALKGEYVPIYAQWKYGKGSVGSFMCDLNGTWSSQFIGDPTGERILANIVRGLFPTEDISVRDINATLKTDNYSAQMSVYTSIQEGDSVKVNLEHPAGEDGEQSLEEYLLDISPTKNRFTFETRETGLHVFEIEKTSGDKVTSYTIYRAFSYSQEYNAFVDEKVCLALMESLAEYGNGTMIKDRADVFKGFNRTLHKTYDPRIPFMITVLVLFLLDVAVRKFKFKWIHELVRAAKEKKSAK